MDQTNRYQILKINLNLLIKNEFNFSLDCHEESPYIITQDNSLFIEQLKRIFGDKFIYKDGDVNVRIPQIILVEARKNAKKNEYIEKLIRDGFKYNQKQYVRYGKSASQGKDGITMFIDEEYYDEIFEASQLDIPIKECVISKYEAQRNLILSVCTVINQPLPRIVIVDEYTKIIPNQHIKYVEEKLSEITDKDTGEKKTINNREIKDGIRDIKILPFDGCGCHSKKMSEIWSESIGLDYRAIGYQIRLPFFKGYSVEVPFEEFYKSIGVYEIEDIFGQKHRIDNIDCIWNTSMWKGYGIFKKEFGLKSWDEYVNKLNKYEYKLGISKYSHHKKDLPLKTRMNFQYLQCLDLWNPKYIEWYSKNPREKYDVFDVDNKGKIIRLAEYTTNLYEKIIKGEKLYTYKFMGIDDTDNYDPQGNYIKAALINDSMLKDPAIKQYIHRKLKKQICQAKYGKVYADGFYHTCVGDMIGYLEYVAKKEPIGCIYEGEFFCDTIPKGKILSFRSPLVCPSEVNEVIVVDNKITKKWFQHFKDQDVVMYNMYDLSMPQQGGADADGDVLFLCHDPNIIDNKINKTMIIDVDDKITAKIKPYTKENIIEYEMNSRDNRIGEITNVATSILNQYVTDEKWVKNNEDNISLLRILQGKEIDFQKTGVRWQMNKWMRKQGKKIPYFLLYNYPEKMKFYYNIQAKNRKIECKNDKLELNAYHSPSPLNELCDYILNWEKKRVIWDNNCNNTKCLILNNNLNLDDSDKRRAIKKILFEMTENFRNAIKDKQDDERIDIDKFCKKYISELDDIEKDKNLLANYCISIAYSNMTTNKSLVWHYYGDVILENLKQNSPINKSTRIVETQSYNPRAHEYLGKYYEMIEGVPVV